MSDPYPLGEIKPTPGTPATIWVNFPAFEHELCNAIILQVLPGNQQDVYFGRENMNVATKVGIIYILRPPTANYLPDWVFQIPDSMNPFRVGAYRLDVDFAGDGARASLVQL